MQKQLRSDWDLYYAWLVPGHAALCLHSIHSGRFDLNNRTSTGVLGDVDGVEETGAPMALISGRQRPLYTSGVPRDHRDINLRVP